MNGRNKKSAAQHHGCGWTAGMGRERRGALRCKCECGAEHNGHFGLEAALRQRKSPCGCDVARMSAPTFAACMARTRGERQLPALLWHSEEPKIELLHRWKPENIRAGPGPAEVSVTLYVSRSKDGCETRAAKCGDGRRFSKHAGRFLDLRLDGLDPKKRNEMPGTKTNQRLIETS